MGQWDVFISHASEDEAAVAAPLADALQQAGVRVWIDSTQLRAGDSIRAGVDAGLGSSALLVVVLSPRYLEKHWTLRELDGILSLEKSSNHRLFPVWHELTEEMLRANSPTLAGRIAVSTSQGIDHVAREIRRTLGHNIEDSPRPAPLASPATLLGTSIGRYRLTGIVGRGGSGIVFRAEVAKGSVCALKLFFPLRPAFAHLTSLFERGFRAAQAVSHPNVLPVLDHGQCTCDARSTSFLVTPLIEGSDLEEWLKAHPDDVEARYEIARQLVSAVEACHRASFVDELGFQVTGVPHGDIKPANILVDSSNRPYLTDFLQIDAQRLADLRPDTEPRPITGAFGTLGYMHPDQERFGILAPYADIYSLVVTLSHLFLPGPFRRDAAVSFLYSQELGHLSEFQQLVRQVVGERQRLTIDNVKAAI